MMMKSNTRTSRWGNSNTMLAHSMPGQVSGSPKQRQLGLRARAYKKRVNRTRLVTSLVLILLGVCRAMDSESPPTAEYLKKLLESNPMHVDDLENLAETPKDSLTMVVKLPNQSEKLFLNAKGRIKALNSRVSPDDIYLEQQRNDRLIWRFKANHASLYIITFWVSPRQSDGKYYFLWVMQPNHGGKSQDTRYQVMLNNKGQMVEVPSNLTEKEGFYTNERKYDVWHHLSNLEDTVLDPDSTLWDADLLTKLILKTGFNTRADA